MVEVSHSLVDSPSKEVLVVAAAAVAAAAVDVLLVSLKIAAELKKEVEGKEEEEE